MLHDPLTQAHIKIQLLDRPSGTTKKEHMSPQKTPFNSRNYSHSSGSLGLERSKTAFAAVKQRFEECHDASNLRWYEAPADYATTERHGQPTFR
jgi:hypothetical protein